MDVKTSQSLTAHRSGPDRIGVWEATESGQCKIYSISLALKQIVLLPIYARNKFCTPVEPLPRCPTLTKLVPRVRR